MKVLPTSIAILFLAFTAISQDIDPGEELINKLAKHYDEIPQEKVYLHLNKTHFTAGEDLWFSAYVREASLHTATQISTILYVELIDPDGNILYSRNLKIKSGKAIGDFELSDDMVSGTYTIRAYTQYMRNFDDAYFFNRAIEITNVTNEGADIASVPNEEQTIKIDLQFFPEGGELVNGLESTVAFKTIDQHGRNLNIQGWILNDLGDTLARIKSDKFGMGKFRFTPLFNQDYIGHIQHNRVNYQLKLPSVESNGFSLSMTKGYKSLTINIRSNPVEQLKDAILIGHTRGEVFAAYQLNTTEDSVVLQLPTEYIPSGIAHFTLFDRQSIPRAERLFFINNRADQISLKIHPESEQLSTRQKAKFNISIPDGEWQNANLSAAVTNQAYSSDRHENIQSYLLLSSDLRGQIDKPGYFFNPDNRDRNSMLDLVMLTHGWRRFNWQDILAGKRDSLFFQPEKGFSLSGQLFKYYQREEAITGMVNMLQLAFPVSEHQSTTDEHGHFNFDQLDIADSTNIILQASKISNAEKKKKKANKAAQRNDAIFIALNEYQPPAFNPRSITPTFKSKQQLINQAIKINQIAAAFALEEQVTILDEVEIEGQKYQMNDPYYQLRKSYINPDHRFMIDSIPQVRGANSILDIMRTKISGLSVTGLAGSEVIRFARDSITRMGMGQTDVHILLDGYPIDHSTALNLWPGGISHIDVLRGSSATIAYGDMARGGAIVIYSKVLMGQDNNRLRDRWGIIDFTHPGYYQARTFYTPKYEKDLPGPAKPDYRHTLFWTPNLDLNSGQPGSLEFYTSDEKATYLINVEGISVTGKIVTGQHVFEVK